MDELRTSIARVVAESGFTGVVRIDTGEGTELAEAFGDADRAHGIANRLDTRFGMASGSKSFTALAIARLIEQGLLEWSTPARSLLGSDLPQIDDAVTVEHLLSNTSGIGDYLDEDELDDITAYVLGRPVHELATTEAFIPLLDGHAQVTAPGTSFVYNNGGFMVLALVAERAAGEGFHDLVQRLVLEPAGLQDTGYLRSDELPGSAAAGYLDRDSLRTNVLHLPVRGNGDGGCFTTVHDVHVFWKALFDGAIVSGATLAEMLRPRHLDPGEAKRYGLGFWLHETSSAVILEGYDAGVSFCALHDPERALTWTVVSNWSDGAWPLVRLLEERCS